MKPVAAPKFFLLSFLAIIAAASPRWKPAAAGLKSSNGPKIQSNPSLGSGNPFFFDIRMNHTPSRVDEYAYARTVYNQEDAYITSMELLDLDPSVTHHMILSSSGQGLVFVWAHKAPGFKFRPKTGLPIKKGSPLSLVTHYLVPSSAKATNGVRLYLTKDQPKYVVKSGSIEAPSNLFKIPPGAFGHVVKHHCTVKGGPAAFNAIVMHAHSHGMQVILKKYGKKTKGKNEIVHFGNPQKPQATTLITSVEVQNGDILTLKCLYNTEKENMTVSYGVGRNEMCGVYYFYTGNKFHCG